MSARSLLLLALALFALGSPRSAPAAHHDHGHDHAHAKPPAGLELATLLKADLERVDDTEVIVSRVTIPPNTSLPKHWHPGEEFAHVLEGTVTLWQEGKEDITGHAGDTMNIPLKQIHTAFTGDEGAVILVFRVHEKGQPERVLVD